MAARRAAWIADNGPCRQCGSSDRLEVDHIDPEQKKHKISALWSWSAARRAAELAKCQVLCFRCHKDKSAAFLEAKIVHGSERMYRIKHCRCEPCRAWKKQENAKRKERGWL